MAPFEAAEVFGVANDADRGRDEDDDEDAEAERVPTISGWRNVPLASGLAVTGLLLEGFVTRAAEGDSPLATDGVVLRFTPTVLVEIDEAFEGDDANATELEDDSGGGGGGGGGGRDEEDAADAVGGVFPVFAIAMSREDAGVAVAAGDTVKEAADAEAARDAARFALYSSSSSLKVLLYA